VGGIVKNGVEKQTGNVVVLEEVIKRVCEGASIKTLDI